jgi:GGDEF domain-containing protein
MHCSIGTAIYPQDGKDSEALLRYADKDMYRVKDQGRVNLDLFEAGAGANSAPRRQAGNQ